MSADEFRKITGEAKSNRARLEAAQQKKERERIAEECKVAKKKARDDYPGIKEKARVAARQGSLKYEQPIGMETTADGTYRDEIKRLAKLDGFEFSVYSQEVGYSDDTPNVNVWTMVIDWIDR